MTYEDRLKHRELVERTAALRDRLEAGAADAPLTRAEGRELAALVDEVILQLSPERWDRLMETIAEEAARRAGALAVPK